MAGIDWKRMGAMIGPALQQELGRFPPEAQAALRGTGVYVTRDGSGINVEARSRQGDADAEKMRKLLLDNLVEAIPQVIKMFGCRVFIKND